MFDDTVTRHNLETRLTYMKPVEILLPETISVSTTKLVSQYVSQRYGSSHRMLLFVLHGNKYFFISIAWLAFSALMVTTG